jgi:hypothetical protein
VNEGNSMDIPVIGPGQGYQDGFEQDDDLGRLIEENDAAITSSMGIMDRVIRQVPLIFIATI